MIVLNNKFSIDTRGPGCTLHFREEREKEEIVDKVKTGKMVKYLAKDSWNMLTVSQCLMRFVEVSLEDTADVKGILERLDYLKDLIEDIELHTV